MKLTRQEIVLLGALLLAVATGAVVKRYRSARPVDVPSRFPDVPSRLPNAPSHSVRPGTPKPASPR